MELDKNPERIEGLFDDITPTYDRLNHLMSMSIDRIWRGQALDCLELKDGDMVLDIATGTGDMAIQALSRVDCTLVGIDLSRNMLQIAVEKWKREEPGSGFPAVQGDALSMPFKEAAFDKAMVAFGIRNVQDVGAFLAEVNRVMKNGGRFAVLELSVPKCRVTRPLYLTYLTRILPLVGSMQSGDLAAYQYLSDSILSFPVPEELEKTMISRGFRIVRSISQTQGICHLYVLEKVG
ncbi:MAG: bifunctional demethylmenaquinone methyltransferase/2-methoxy-6-polyprenyl-1,4-benzoquinol methylase UbiE [Methanomassiliicoccales archaeon]|jgi:demethylmenaquinone methyltransferase/2-methoxy-6-polyprenyl-1,4-benzoquinol methylase